MKDGVAVCWTRTLINHPAGGAARRRHAGALSSIGRRCACRRHVACPYPAAGTRVA
ncbi:hypothetical protein P4233_01665 [Pseudomonas aeruginosa]|nr:hypothetical protein [Pseudomonas aeruginosa]